MNTETHTASHHYVAHGARRAYVIGYVLSVLLTLAAFALVAAYGSSGGMGMSKPVVISLLLLLAIGQLAVQLVCFLHIDKESGPRWRLIAFFFAAFLVVAVVAGSIWIMYNLNYNMMSPGEMDMYMLDQ